MWYGWIGLVGVWLYLGVWVFVYVIVWLCVCVTACVHEWKHVCVWMCVWCVHVYVNVCAYVRLTMINVHRRVCAVVSESISQSLRVPANLCMYMSLCMYVCMYVCVCVCVCINICISLFEYDNKTVHVRMYVLAQATARIRLDNVRYLSFSRALFFYLVLIFFQFLLRSFPCVSPSICHTILSFMC